MLSIDEIVMATKGKLLSGSGSFRVSGISTDTRKITKGNLFVAIKGDNFDGHNFIGQAVQAGAGAVMVDHANVADAENAVVIVVEDTVKALGAIARFHRKRFKIPVIGITGSAGKTSTKEFIASVLGKKYRVLFNKGTENNHIGVPMTLLQLTKDHEIAVLELGTNHFGEIAYLADIVRPTVAVFTNVGASHLAGLGSPEGVFKEKVTMIDYLPKNGKVIFNADDPLLRNLKKKKLSQNITTYAIDNKADVKAKAVHSEKGGLIVTLEGGETIKLKAPVWGNILNALAAVVCGSLFRVSFDDIREGLLNTDPAKGRQCFHLASGVTVIDDTYNANPVSYRNALRTLSLLPRKGRVFLVAADMLELGEASDVLHAEIGELAAQSGVDTIFATGRWASLIGSMARAKNSSVEARYFDKKEDIILALRDQVQFGDIVLVKGSRGMRMESVVVGLLEHLNKGRPA
ncbi:MAG: UDP-N-acetylmuramoyl-tripeptide--D-alanyl-D-alanine ligase [Candidatus Omnitrophica bacterium]|nr:UDP-N-acetylmuramoyl-tripeptide--D-alanyl-D-alanine ligase [Candidatus Omnitrophota bacterium]